MSTTTHQAVQPEFRLLVLLVSIGFFMQALDTTIVNTAIPGMAAQLNENPLQMHGVIVAYVLSVAACIPLSGWLADRFGIRNVYLASMMIFSLASLGCGLSQNLNQLLFFRVIQGVGGALLMPVGRLALLKIIPRSQFLSAMSLMSLAGLIGPLMGPTLGGWLVEVATWHWIFLINLPMGVLGMIMTLKDLPQQDASSGNSFLSMIMMLSMSIGVALAGTLINVFGQHFSTASLTTAFHATLITLGCINLVTALVFWQIPKEMAD